MKRLLEDKAQSFHALGRAAVDLAKAEGQSLSGELKGSGKSLGRSALLILLGLFALFWAIGALAFLAVELLALELPRWGAVLLVFGALLLLALTLAALGWRRLERLERPAAMIRRHWSEYRDWWAGRWMGERRTGRDASGGDEVH